MEPVCVAFKAHQGWVNAVAVRVSGKTPAPLLAQRVDLIDAGDRETLEPYHVAGGWSGLERVPRPPDPDAIIRRGRRRQVNATRRRLEQFRHDLAERDLDWRRAVVLTGRGRLGDDLDHILASHAQIHIAEGEAIRDATRGALEALQLTAVDQDEKSILAEAGRRLDGADGDRLIRPLRPAGAKSWGKEERVIALGAWLNRA